MSQHSGPKGKNATAKPRKKATQSEIASRITAMKKRLVFHPFQNVGGR